MGDISAFHFPYHGFSVPNGIPFYPIVKINGDDKKVTFNQGYVFDFTSSKGNKGVNKIKVTGCDEEYDASSKTFYLEIKTTQDLANVQSAEVKEGEPSSTPKDHYTAKNLEADSVYQDGQGIFKIPICQLDAEGNIIEWSLRENIQWQKINFENNASEGDASFGVLYNWGDETSFNDNPTVKFSQIVQATNEKIISVERSEEGKNIVITTQIPDPDDNKVSVLSYDEDFSWVEANSDKDQIFTNSKGSLEFFDVPESADGSSYKLLDGGGGLSWVNVDETEVDACVDNEIKTLKILTIPEAAG